MPDVREKLNGWFKIVVVLAPTVVVGTFTAGALNYRVAANEKTLQDHLAESRTYIAEIQEMKTTNAVLIEQMKELGRGQEKLQGQVEELSHKVDSMQSKIDQLVRERRGKGGG